MPAAIVQGLPVWMEHPAAMDIAGMEAAGVSLDDICFYQVRVSPLSPLLGDQRHADGSTSRCWHETDADTVGRQTAPQLSHGGAAGLLVGIDAAA